MRRPTALTLAFLTGTAALTAATPALASQLALPPQLAAPARATTLTVHAAKSTVAPKAKDAITGSLQAGKSPVSGQKVLLEKRAYGAKSFSRVATATTGSKGTVSFTVVPGTKKGQREQYELVFSGTSAYKASHSGITTVTVK